MSSKEFICDPQSREDFRKFAKAIRRKYGYENQLYFPIEKLFDQMALDFNFEYESGSNNYGDFQNAIEHEYYYRNGKELNDFGIDNYALLFNEYYGVDINTAREYLKYSENYNSEDNTLTPVYDWREENYSGDADILYIEQEGDIFTAYVLIKYSEDYMIQYSYTYSFDENGYFKMLDSSGNIYSLCYCEDSA